MTRSRVAFLLVAACLVGSCSSRPRPQGPQIILWAWERPEDLRIAAPESFGVAYLAQSITLNGPTFDVRRRKQSLRLADRAYLIAVTRIEAKDPELSVLQKESAVQLILESAAADGVRSVQIDFDARESEREFYADLIRDVRAKLPSDTSLSITALASWCAGDPWINDLPVDEAVPMLFDLGPDGGELLRKLSRGDDWTSAKCRTSYGLSVDSPLPAGLKPGRRMYYFKAAAWQPPDIERLKQKL